MAQDTFKTLSDFTPSPGKKGRYHSLAALEEAGHGKISRLPNLARLAELEPRASQPASEPAGPAGS